ncbi:MAG TPA: DUF4349 domain-containing protein [Fimbriimonadaceae bacterium]|nr:DUF4349 domain-containing protein [Fimbriimonadaceae bacterium]
MEDLKAYVDGELSPARRSEIETAMEQDEALRQEVEEIRVLSRLIGDCVVELEPVGLSETLALLERRKPRPLFIRLFTEPRRLAWVWAMSLFLLVAILMPLVRRSDLDQSVAFNTGETASSDKAAASGQAEIEKAPARVQSGLSGGKSKAVSRSGVDEDVNSPDRQTKGSRGTGSSGYTMNNGTPSKGGAGFGIEIDGLPSQAEMQPTAPKPAGPAEHKQREVAQRATRQLLGQPPLLIRDGDLTVQVASVKKAAPEATTLAKSLGGYVESSSSSSDENDVPQAQMTLRIPEPKFDQAMTGLSKLGLVKSESVTGQDVTAQVADTEARVKVLKTSEQSYIAMLAKARKVDDALSIRDRLDDVRQQIESMEAQAKTLRDQATYSTITLALAEKVEAPKPQPAPGWFDTAWSGAVERASGLGKWLAEVGMNLVLLAPAWVPIVGLAWWLGRRRRG